MDARGVHAMAAVVALVTVSSRKWPAPGRRGEAELQTPGFSLRA